jgi:hypothetical protein
MNKWIVLLLLAAAIACGKTSDTDIPNTSAGVMVFNMAPNAAAFDVLVDTVTVGSNLAYGENSTTYKRFRAQKYNLWVYAAGNHSTALLGGELNLRNGHDYSVFLTIDSTNTLRVLLTQDDHTLPAEKANASIRVIDLSDPYVKVGTGTNKQSLALDFYLDTIRLYRRLGYGAVTSFTEVVGHSYEAHWNWVDSSLILQRTPLAPEPGKVYTLIATGNVLNSTYKLWQFVHE